MTIFISSKYSSRFRLRPIKDEIVRMGYDVSSTWIAREDGDYPVPPGRAKREARLDLKEVKQADMIILDTLDESTTGGREVEFGVAIAKGVHVWHVGPVRNIFHSLAHKHFDNWDDALRFLKEWM